MDVATLLKDNINESQSEFSIPEPVAPAEDIEPVIEQIHQQTEVPHMLDKMAGLPTRQGILTMMRSNSNRNAGLDKLSKHKKFASVLEAIENYQQLMNTQVDLTFKDNVVTRNKNYYISAPDGDKLGRRDNLTKKAELDQCILALQNVIDCAKEAISSQSGLFGALERRSSTVRNLTPVIAQVLVQAYALAPKVAGLQDAISTYSIENDKDIFSFADVLAGKSIGLIGDNLVTTGVEDQSNTSIKRAEIEKALKNKTDLNIKAAMGRNQLKENLLSKQMPLLPIEMIKLSNFVNAAESVSENGKLTEEYNKGLNKYLDAVDYTHSVFTRRLLEIQNALDQLAETEGIGGGREIVKKRKAMYMPLSRLISKVLANQTEITNAFENGKITEGSYLSQVVGYGGMTLSNAIDSAYAAYEKDIIEFDASNRKKEEGKEADYKLLGGGLNVATLDFRSDVGSKHDFLNEGRVFRYSKDTGKNHKDSVNGMYDEAVGLISKFLGWDIAAQATAAVQRDHEGNLRYGGSVMELAKGKENAEKYNFVAPNTKIVQSSKNKKLDTADGDFLRNFQQMTVLDYLCFHTDRNTKNYMVDMEAQGSKIKAIDNDMVFGEDPTGIDSGGQLDIAALSSVKGRQVRTHATELASGLHSMDPGIKQAILQADPQAFNRLLMPYVQRVARIAAVRRLYELKDYASSVPDVNFAKREECERFLKNGAIIGLKNMMRDKNIETASSMSVSSLISGNGILQQTRGRVELYQWGGADVATEIHSAIQYGISKEELLGILAHHPLFERERENVERLANEMYDLVERNPEMDYEEYAKKYKLRINAE